MLKNKLKWIVIVLVVLAIGGFFIFKAKQNNSTNEVVKEIDPLMGEIKVYISTTGTVLPKNRLEIKPPVSGRIERILVQEGQKVKAGEILAWMSSTDRAALLDAARGQGEAAFKYWDATYKSIPLPAPIGGEVIVATTQPGQTVTTSDAVIVLSDHLIVRAQVDETDIGKIKVGQKALVKLDAYPDMAINGKVEHIYYESKTVNNVTIYEVDLVPEEMPGSFRSGMNASVDFEVESKSDILIVPVTAVYKDKDESYVLINSGKKDPLKTKVALGITDDKNVEIISGVSLKDKLILKGKKYTIPKNEEGTNPFMPARRR